MMGFFLKGLAFGGHQQGMTALLADSGESNGRGETGRGHKRSQNKRRSHVTFPAESKSFQRLVGSASLGCPDPALNRCSAAQEVTEPVPGSRTMPGRRWDLGLLPAKFLPSRNKSLA
jgi:hypothetical protein